MSDLQNVTYCGLYCKLCATKSRIPKRAKALKDALMVDSWDDYGEYILPGFKRFWSTLNELADFDNTSSDCRGGCGDPDCDIRRCATDQKIDLCPFCGQYPCKHIIKLAQRYPNLIGDSERLKKIGVTT
jgi:hypothetical protein